MEARPAPIPASEATTAWLRRYYELIDSGRLAELDAFHDPQLTVRFANHASLAWDELPRQFNRDVGGNVVGVAHEITLALEAGEELAYELLVTYTRRDGSRVTLPGAAFCRVRNGRFVEQRFYVDLTPVRA